MAKNEAPEPMDPGVRESRSGAGHQNHERVCWAVKTLVNEFHDLFPETPVEYSNYNGRATAMDVGFDLTSLTEDDRLTATTLLEAALDPDNRVSKTIFDDDLALVSMKSNPRTQDDRTSFNLGEAYEILTEDMPDAEGADIVAPSHDSAGEGSL